MKQRTLSRIRSAMACLHLNIILIVGIITWFNLWLDAEFHNKEFIGMDPTKCYWVKYDFIKVCKEFVCIINEMLAGQVLAPWCIASVNP